MRKAGKISIRREIFNSSLIFTAIILVIFSLLLSYILYNVGMSKAYNIIKQRNYAINFYLDGYFSEINNTINVLAAHNDVQNAPWLEPSDRQRVLNLYKSFSEANKNITYVYSGYKNGLLLINDYIPPEGYDPVTRPWYQSAMSVKPEVTTGIPYQEIKDNEWLLSTSKALFSKSNGYSGVISIDSSIKMIADLLKQRGDVYKTSYSFVTKLDGEVLLHHNEAYLKRPMSEIIGSPVTLDKNEGRIVYKLGNTEKFAFYSRCNKADWIVVTVVVKKEIINPIIWQIFISIMLTGLIAVLLGVAQSSMLSRRFSNPLIELQKRVNAIISGNSYKASDYKYPDNEIGLIAKEVGQLAEHELYIKSKELTELNAKLTQTIEEIKTLRGILPICASCKKIRDDKGYWNQIESYIRDRSDAEFSHSICPECAKKLYPDMDIYDDNGEVAQD